MTKSSGVKLIGLGTAAALRGEPGPDEDPELEDTLDLGRLLYACLTARWPGGDNPGHRLPDRSDRARSTAAPSAGARRRTATARMPSATGSWVSSRATAPPITTVDEVIEALNEILAEEGANTGVNLSVSSTPSSPHRLEPPPALLLREGEDPPTGEQPSYNTMHGEPTSSLRRTLGWTALGLADRGCRAAGLPRRPVRDQREPRRDRTVEPGPDLAVRRPQAAAPADRQRHRLRSAGRQASRARTPNRCRSRPTASKTTAWTTLEYRDQPEAGHAQGRGRPDRRPRRGAHGRVGQPDAARRTAPTSSCARHPRTRRRHPTDSADSFDQVASRPAPVRRSS